MVTIFGPACPTRPPSLRSDEIQFVDMQPVVTEASTLAEAISAYCKAFDVRVEPYDGSWVEVPFASGEEPKFFVHEDALGQPMLVDIHIAREKQFICAKQNLAFPLRDGDQVRMGLLAC